MLSKQKKAIANNLFNSEEANCRYSCDDDTLRIFLDEKTHLQNKEIDTVSIWKVKDGNKEASIIFNKINSLDVVALISIVDNKEGIAYATIKQTPTNMYVYYGEEVIGYDINNCNSNTVINIMEDYFNKNNMLKNNMEVVLKIVKTDIDEVFSLMHNQKQAYLDNLEHSLNNINARYLMDSEKVKRMIRTVNNYSENN